jgi:hypothetical protein
MERGELAIDNLGDGFTLHEIDRGASICDYRPTMQPMRTPGEEIRAIQVTFAEDGRAIAIGSNHGVAYVFDKATGEALAVLNHSKHRMAQSVSVSEWLSRLGHS